MAHDNYALAKMDYLSHDFYIGSTRSVVWGNCVDNADNVSLHHAHVVDMTLLVGHLQEVFDEIHDVGPCIHRVLGEVSLVDETMPEIHKKF